MEGLGFCCHRPPTSPLRSCAQLLPRALLSPPSLRAPSAGPRSEAPAGRAPAARGQQPQPKGRCPRRGRDRDRDRSPPGGPRSTAGAQPAHYLRSSGASRPCANAVVPRAACPPATPKTHTFKKFPSPTLKNTPPHPPAPHFKSLLPHLFLGGTPKPSVQRDSQTHAQRNWHLQRGHRLTFASPASGSSS